MAGFVVGVLENITPHFLIIHDACDACDACVLGEGVECKTPQARGKLKLLFMNCYCYLLLLLLETKNLKKQPKTSD
eukprot:m.20650 g.20650  ORF g.20650 m.20650 type:complete len:76 (-) comp8598_c0_seq3:20-247(-)